MSGDILKDPFGPDVAMPRIEHAVVDEQMQMQHYLADIALEDLRLLPDPSARRVRPGSLLAGYQADVAERHAVEDAGGAIPPAAEEIDIGLLVGTNRVEKVPLVMEFEKKD